MMKRTQSVFVFGLLLVLGLSMGQPVMAQGFGDMINMIRSFTGGYGDADYALDMLEQQLQESETQEYDNSGSDEEFAPPTSQGYSQPATQYRTNQPGYGNYRQGVHGRPGYNPTNPLDLPLDHTEVPTPEEEQAAWDEYNNQNAGSAYDPSIPGNLPLDEGNDLELTAPTLTPEMMKSMRESVVRQLREEIVQLKAERAENEQRCKEDLDNNRAYYRDRSATCKSKQRDQGPRDASCDAEALVSEWDMNSRHIKERCDLEISRLHTQLAFQEKQLKAFQHAGSKTPVAINFAGKPDTLQVIDHEIAESELELRQLKEVYDFEIKLLDKQYANDKAYCATHPQEWMCREDLHAKYRENRAGLIEQYKQNYNEAFARLHSNKNAAKMVQQQYRDPVVVRGAKGKQPSGGYTSTVENGVEVIRWQRGPQ